jgi:hypothetical protein
MKTQMSDVLKSETSNPIVPTKAGQWWGRWKDGPWRVINVTGISPHLVGTHSYDDVMRVDRDDYWTWLVENGACVEVTSPHPIGRVVADGRWPGDDRVRFPGTKILRLPSRPHHGSTTADWKAYAEKFGQIVDASDMRAGEFYVEAFLAER